MGGAVTIARKTMLEPEAATVRARAWRNQEESAAKRRFPKSGVREGLAPRSVEN
jgi:hypothetical protein